MTIEESETITEKLIEIFNLTPITEVVIHTPTSRSIHDIAITTTTHRSQYGCKKYIKFFFTLNHNYGDEYFFEVTTLYPQYKYQIVNLYVDFLEEILIMLWTKLISAKACGYDDNGIYNLDKARLAIENMLEELCPSKLG